MTENERMGSRDRQRQIIDTSLAIVDKEGIKGLTLRKISSEIGITDAALLKHFRSKEEIVEAMAQKVFFDNVVEEEEPRTDDPSTALHSLMSRQFEAFDRSPQSTAILFQEDIFREYPEIRAWFIKRRSERHSKISSIVARGMRSGRLPSSLDPESFATIYMGAMRMAVMEWRDSGYAWELKDRSVPLVEMMLRMLR